MAHVAHLHPKGPNSPPDSQFSKCRFPGSSPSLEPLPTHSPGLTGTQLPTSPAATWLHRGWKIGAGRGREGTSQSKRLRMEGLEHRHIMTNLRSFNDQPRVPKSTLCWSACQCSIFRFRGARNRRQHPRDTEVVASTFPFTSAGKTGYIFFSQK